MIWKDKIESHILPDVLWHDSRGRTGAAGAFLDQPNNAAVLQAGVPWVKTFKLYLIKMKISTVYL